MKVKRVEKQALDYTSGASILARRNEYKEISIRNEGYVSSSEIDFNHVNTGNINDMEIDGQVHSR